MPAALISREQAVARIAEVFRAHGFEGTSLSAITEATRLGKGSLYNYFPGGKEEMAAEVLRRIAAWFEGEVFAPLRGPDDAAVALARMFANVERYFHGGGRICLVGAFALDATRDRFAAAVQAYFAQWIDALETALAKGGAAEPRVLAEATVAAIQGALVLGRALGDGALFRRQLARQHAILDSALA